MGLNYSLGWVKFCGRILAVVSYDIRVQSEGGLGDSGNAQKKTFFFY